MSTEVGPTGASYRVVCADPPWRYRKDGVDRRGLPGIKRWAEQNYLTMSNAAIRDLPVREWVAPDAHCYLWVTSPRMYGERGDRSVNPADILEAWGFEYVSTLVWVKAGAPGMGNYFRIDAEYVLFGVRGRCPIPRHLRRSSVFHAPKGRHSEKPEAFYRIVEDVSPSPRLEMFARRRREGWDSWGNEVPDETQRQMFRPEGDAA